MQLSLIQYLCNSGQTQDDSKLGELESADGRKERCHYFQQKREDGWDEAKSKSNNRGEECAKFRLVRKPTEKRCEARTYPMWMQIGAMIVAVAIPATPATKVKISHTSCRVTYY